MTYNELLTKMSSQMQSATVKASSSRIADTVASPSSEDTTSIMLNKIGLEVQRQGGY